MARLDAMEVFAEVVEAESFSAAARRLEISKSAVSKQIARLEDRLGVRLLNRTTRRLSLTEAGATYYAACRRVLDEAETAERAVSNLAAAPHGLLKLNAPMSFGFLHLAAAIPAFHARYPEITVEAAMNDRFVDLVEEGYDLAVRITRLPSSTLVSRKLSSTRMILCASPQYLARAGVPAHPSALAEHAVLAYSYLAAGDDWPFEGPDGPVTAKIRPCVRSNSGDICRAGALQHQGIVLQPSFLVGPDIEAGRLVEVLPEYRSLEIGIYAVYPTRKQVSPKVHLLIDFLVEAFRTPRWRD